MIGASTGSGVDGLHRVRFEDPSLPSLPFFSHFCIVVAAISTCELLLAFSRFHGSFA
jgi:hypothetical protein